jgi:hypothetical protein
MFPVLFKGERRTKMLQIVKQKMMKDGKAVTLISIKIEDLANYLLIVQNNLFSEIMISDFIKMMTGYIIMDDPEIQIIEEDNVPPDKIFEYHLK